MFGTEDQSCGFSFEEEEMELRKSSRSLTRRIVDWIGFRVAILGLGMMSSAKRHLFFREIAVCHITGIVRAFENQCEMIEHGSEYMQ